MNPPTKLECGRLFVIIALSHIRVSAAYRSCMDENNDTPRSEAYFVLATYVSRTCDIPVAYQGRIGTSLSYVRFIKAYVLPQNRLRTCDVQWR